jgi:hypothetical protein
MSKYINATNPSLKDYFNNEKYSDIKVKLENGEMIPSHKMVLSRCNKIKIHLRWKI